MLLPALHTLPLLAALLASARAEVALASDTKRWSLTGNTTTVRRSQLSDFCPPPVGQENELVILVDEQQFSGNVQAAIRFTGKYITLCNADDAISISLDNGGSQEPAGWPDVIPQSSLNAKTGAACDIVLTKFPNLVPGSYSIGVSTVGSSQRIAVYNVTIFASSILSTPTTASQPKDTSATDSTTSIRTTESSSSQPANTSSATNPTTLAANKSSVSSSSSATTGAHTQATTREPGGDGLAASHIAAIVLPSVLAPVILGVLCLWLRHRRRSQAREAAEGSSLHPFLASAPSPPSQGTPSTEKGLADLKIPDAVSATSYTPSAGSSSLGTEATPAAHLGRMARTTRARPTAMLGTIGDAAVSDDAATADPAQLIAIQRAVRQAGFSTQALLDSLNRVRPSTDLASGDDPASPAPPHYDG
ncbi:hypothetical protein AURDEDRAFT_129366 [Auricularia subglabra TFB-10046 SS5]|uniref:Mid2 domain-containing protein n=1 Tax=Auricularia subglabra (strain TFB-10046 / SS5) TaxID=717982 RepID=J0D077_AURST|nr:hypothetical protein AURDEDRAFT_129366 [Auricularia subglabra TFB-10046 SS5]